jgi:hypothetical protein
MRTISLRLDDTTDAVLTDYCQRHGLTQTRAVRDAILHLVETDARQTLRPTPAELAERFGLIGAFRSVEGDLGEQHAAHLKARLRARQERDA